jgi:uncharacterized protein with FMN-binding domain
MNRRVTAAVGALALTAPVGNAVAAIRTAAAKPLKKVTSVTKRVSGPAVETGRWGPLQVTLVVKKTTTKVGKSKRVIRKIVGVDVPVYPDHTDRSIFINQQAIPYLRQEVLAAQFDSNIDLISGATDTSYAFVDSLQAAILRAKQV